MTSRVLAFITILITALQLPGQVNVTTQRYDGFRTSSNLHETILNPNTVSSSNFGKLWSYQVDGFVYAQPLYVQNVNVAGVGVRNVVYIATMHDVVYAFDADNPGKPLWTADLRNPSAGITPYQSANFANQEWVHAIGDAYGIQSTPVIDLSSNLMYVVAQTSEPSGIVYRIHAFDIRTGAEQMPAPIIQATSQGVTFDALHQQQRAALALTGGQVYVAFAGRPADDTPYHGWVLAYNAANLSLSGAFLATTTTNGGGIWQGGGGPAVDENGNVYVVTGNGFGGGDGVTNLSESLIKLTYANGQLTATDWFTPANFAALDASDYDLGSGGPLVIPGAGMTAFGSKSADFYLANNSNLAKLSTNNVGLTQFSHIGTGYPAQYQDSNLIIGLALWPKPQGSILYGWPAQDFLYSYTLNGNLFQSTGTGTVQSHSAPGAAMVVSANGTTSGSGILWSLMSLVPGGDSVGKPGVLRAFNAESLATELWDSNLNAAQDGIASAAKFAVPTVANGKVYVPTFDGLVHVYGLLKSASFSLSANPSSLTVAQGQTGSTAINVAPLNGFNGTVTYSVSGVPAGVTVSLSPASGGGQTVGFAVAASATGGATYPITFTGISGSLSNSTVVQLTIPLHTGPTVTLTSPANNSTYGVGSTITLGAAVSATGATVSQVSFLQGTTVLANLTQAPFSYNWANVGAGTYTLTAKVMDSLGATATSSPVTVSVTGGTGTNTVSNVDLSSVYNLYAIWSDGTPTQRGALDGLGDGYSSNVLGSTVSALGVSFTFGAPGTANATYGTTVTLPAGTYSALKFLATGNNGSGTPQAQSARNQANQTFVVTYTDGSSTTFTQSLSDLATPQNYAGETVAATMDHMINSRGTNASGPWYLYAYSFALNSGKTVKSITLPNNRGVAVFAMALVASTTPPPPPPPTPTSVSLSSVANVYGIANDYARPVNGGLDNAGYAYSAALTGSSINALGVTFPLGAAGVADGVYGKTINLPNANYSTLKYLAAGVNGNQVSQKFVVTYTDGSTSTFTQSFSDWFYPQNYAGESTASSMAYRITPTATHQAGPFRLYGYSIALNNAKTVKSITLPNNRNVVVMGIYLQ